MVSSLHREMGELSGSRRCQQMYLGILIIYVQDSTIDSVYDFLYLPVERRA